MNDRSAIAGFPAQDVGHALQRAKALVRQGNFAQAIEILSPITHEQPFIAEAHGMLGNAHMLAGDWGRAADAFARAAELIPAVPVAHFGLGSALANQGRFTEAAAAFRRALQLDYPPAHCNLGVALLLSGAFDEAAAELRRAIAFNADDAVAHWNLGLLMLLRGEWPSGWPEYEWRWRWSQFPSQRREFNQPQWRGDDLNGQTILIHAEQGFGDTIQFIRYLPHVQSRGGKLMVECQPELLPLFKELPGVAGWIRVGEALPAFDLHCPLASLPQIFGTTTATVPAQVPLLRPGDDRVALWREKMGESDGRPRIGIAWAGNSTFNGDQTRSIKLEQWRDILAMDERFKFYSLQKGLLAGRIQEMGDCDRLIDLGSGFNDFADTAAVMSLCDLIITTDTSVPHLAGAMGRPVWVMLQYVPDWRWLLDREDSPWYPSARLFRQSAPGDWPGVIARVAQALTNF